jgi:hypothetical protein
MNKKYEMFKWISDICKTASWVGSAILSYFNVPHRGIWFMTATILYFMGMQAIAFRLHIKSLEEKEE